MAGADGLKTHLITLNEALPDGGGDAEKAASAHAPAGPAQVAADRPLNLNDPDDLLQALQKEPYSFDFFQTLRRLECIYSDKVRFGQAANPLREPPVRLGQKVSLDFAPSTLATFKPGEDGKPAHLSVLFMGLFGPNGPLQLHLTEYAYDRQKPPHHDPTFSHIADIFHHRMLSLFYRAWADALPTVQFDRPGEDRFALFLGSLFGFGTRTLHQRDALPDLAKLHYAGLYSCQSRHAEGLRAMLTGFFRLPVIIEEFSPHWLDLPDDDLTRLGESETTGLLGQTVIAGRRIWDCQHKFRIVIGPLDLTDYRRLLPGGASLARLVAMVRNYIDDGLIWDVQLILKKQQVPRLRLNGNGQLGWTSWFTSAPQAVLPLNHDAGDLKLDAMALVAMWTPQPE
jgi:type VI secretion system protein ImpH